MLKIKKAAILLIASLLISCGGGSSNNEQASVVTTNFDSVLVGVWDSTCRDEEIQSLNHISTYGADGSYRFVTNNYLNRNCTELYVVDEVVGSFTEGTSTTLADDRLVTELNRQLLDQRNFTPQTQLAADDFNSIFFCGFDDWQPGVTKNVFGCQSGRITALTFNTFDIYHLQDDHYLYFGAGEGLSPQGRPNELRVSPVLFRRTEEQNFPAEFLGLWRTNDSAGFLEFRRNNVIFTYTEVADRGGCYNAGPLHVRSLGDGRYIDFEQTNLSIALNGNFLSVTSPDFDLNLTLVQATGIASQDLVICSL